MSIASEINKIDKQPSSIYLIIGQNEFWEAKIINNVKALIPDAERTMNYATYDMEDTPLSDAINDAMSMPFFGDRRVVLIKNAYFLSGGRHAGSIKQDVSELEQYVTQASPETVLVIMVPYDKLDGRKKVVKALKKQATVIDLNDMSDREVRKYVSDFVDQKGYSISADVLNELLARTQSDLSKTLNELNKLFIYCANDKQITLAAVDQLVTKSINQNVFSLVNYLMEGKTTAAIEFYQQLLQQKQEPIKINAILEGQFRLLLQVKILGEHGYSQSMMTKELKIHPYRVKLACQSAQHFAMSELQDAYLTLIQNETKLKSSSYNPDLLFEMFAIKFSQKKSSAK